MTQKIIDVHCHIAPLDLPADPTGGKLGQWWPTMKCCDGKHEAIFTSGATSRRFDNRTWDPIRRLEYMDSHGIAMQVLSPLPELLGYWLDPLATQLLCRHVNNVMADIVQQYPNRFQALGGLPLNDIEASLHEAQRLKRLGFAGVEIGSNIQGVSPADKRFTEVLEALHDLDMAIFVHGIRPACEGRLVGPAVLAPIVGLPMDTALCVASFIGECVLHRFPKLRVGFSHGGGALGAVIDRFEHVWNVMPSLKEEIPTSPLEEARRFYYDILTFSPDYTRYLIELVGSDRLFVGTDFPAAGMGLMDPQGFIDSMNLDAETLSRISYANAKSFLRVD